jgi:hypothetical protein
MGALEAVHLGIAADFDGDDDVDADDFTRLKGCASGATNPFQEGCTGEDLDHDGDVDMDDFGRYQRCYSGANWPADPNCSK